HGDAVERLFQRAMLLDRTKYSDYGRATFSFEHGLQNDPGLTISHNDWDVFLQSDRLVANTVVDDNSVLVDLGDVSLDRLGRVELDSLCATVEEAARIAFDPETRNSRDSRRGIEPRTGHAYFLWTRDSDTDQAAAFEVLERV